MRAVLNVKCWPKRKIWLNLPCWDVGAKRGGQTIALGPEGRGHPSKMAAVPGAHIGWGSLHGRGAPCPVVVLTCLHQPAQKESQRSWDVG